MRIGSGSLGTVAKVSIIQDQLIDCAAYSIYMMCIIHELCTHYDRDGTNSLSNELPDHFNN